MAKYIILSLNLMTSTVGPFDSEADAKKWQEADIAKHGDYDDWSIWPLFAPEEAAASRPSTSKASPRSQTS